MLIATVIAAYLLIGFLLAQLAIRQGQPRDASTLLLWTTLWPAGFVLARVLSPPSDMSEPYTLRHMGIYLVAVAVPAAASYVIAQLTSVPFARSFYTVMGVSLLFYGVMRPHWFWNVVRMQDLRLLFGDRFTQVLYIIVGLVLTWLGLFTNVPFPPR